MTGEVTRPREGIDEDRLGHITVRCVRDRIVSNEVIVIRRRVGVALAWLCVSEEGVVVVRWRRRRDKGAFIVLQHGPNML